MKKYLILLITIALLAVMFAGCASSKPITVTSTPTQDPIIGVWRYTDKIGYDDRFMFNADGTFAESTPPGYSGSPKGQKGSVIPGTWSAMGGNSYACTQPVESFTVTFDPINIAISDSRYPLLAHTRYSGDLDTQEPISYPAYVATPKSQPYESMTHEQLMSSAVPVTYENLYRNNEDYVGKLVLIKGQVIQVGSNYLRVATKPLKQGKGYSGDIVYVNSDTRKIMDDDYVDIYGVVDGMKTYTTVLGVEVILPEITSKYLLYEKGD